MATPTYIKKAVSNYSKTDKGKETSHRYYEKNKELIKLKRKVYRELKRAKKEESKEESKEEHKD